MDFDNEQRHWFLRMVHMDDAPMTDAIRAAYSSFKHVPTRSVLQLVLEVPIEQAEAALDLLGIPQPGTQTWCAIARLKEGGDANESAVRRNDAPPQSQVEAGAGRPALTPGEKLVQMAGILANDGRFQEWLRSCGFIISMAKDGEDYAARAIRYECGIASRRELATNPDAQRKFNELVARYKSETGQSTWRKPA